MAGENFDQFGNMTLRGHLKTSSEDGVTASPVQTLAGAKPITADKVRVTSAGANDALRLPVSQPGHEITVIDASGNPIKVFPAAGDRINALAKHVAMIVADGTVTTFHCTSKGQWHSQQGA